MLQYPSILGIKKFPLGNSCVAFYKYDGSNLRFEWSPKKGWSKFGSRTQMIDKNHDVFGEGISLFEQNMADEILTRIKSAYAKQFKNINRITVFAEFYGENSFAGHHLDTDEKKLKLFDVFLFQKGFIIPAEFIDIFGDWEHSAQVVYQGKLNKEFIESVRYNTLDTKLFEGVICKGSTNKIDFKTYGPVWMTKIKTFEYINRLKHQYQERWEEFAE